MSLKVLFVRCANSVLIMLFGLILLNCSKSGNTAELSTSKSVAPSSVITPISETFSPVTQPFAFVLPRISAVEGVGGYKASDCGTCHKKIYEEWKGSTHAHSVKDLQFFAELTKKDSPKWLCLNCHTPVSNQRESLTVGLVENNLLQPLLTKNEFFDADFMREGISCASCHIRNDSSGRSIIIAPHNRGNAPHPVTEDREMLDSICVRCHNPVGEPITANLLCWFTTQSEMEDGDTLKKQSCVGCHMKTENRHLSELSPQFEKQDVPTHKWMGSGIPKWYENYKNKKEYTSALSIGTEFTQNRLQLTLDNRTGGHYIPTADPERFILVLTYQYDKDFQLIQKDSNRIGQTWQWNPAKKIGDNRIKTGEKRVLQIQVDARTVKCVSKIWHVRLNSHSIPFMRETKWKSMFGYNDSLMKTMEQYYPMARLLYHETLNITTKEKTVMGGEALLQKSLDEREVPLHLREY